MMTFGEKILLLICILFLVGNGFLLRLIESSKEDIDDAGYSPQEVTVLQESALQRIFQEIRLTVGDILWLKTDEYIHSGVIYRKMTPEEMLREQALDLTSPGEENDDYHEEHEHDEVLHKSLGYGENHHKEVIAIIPHKDVDFRGFLGKIERAVKPYAPHHVPHKELKELIPWYRLMTLANPHHERAYLVGAYFIYTYGKRPEEAIEFLKEGEQNNPKNPEIKEAIGRFLFYKLNKPQEAIPYYKEAILLFRKEARRRQLADDEHESYRNAYVNLVMIYIKLKDLENAERYYEEVKGLYPNDAPVKNLVPNLRRLRKDLSFTPE